MGKTLVRPAASPHPPSAHRERVSAAALRGLLRVLELEAVEHDRLLVVEHRASEIDDALLVDVELHAIELEGEIALARRIFRKFDHVREARAATTSYAQPDGRVRRTA